ncbi:hypothetical protein [Streptomyces sp. NPDC002671]
MTAGTNAAETARYGAVEHFLGLLVPGGLPPEVSSPGRLLPAAPVTHHRAAASGTVPDRASAPSRRRSP